MAGEKRTAGDRLAAAQRASARLRARRGARPKRGGRKPTRDRLADPTRYIPIDATLSWMPVRVLRALRHMGWADVDDVILATDVSEDDRERNLLSTALYAHVAAKRVRVRELEGRYYRGAGPATLRQYRITAVGERWLEGQLRPDSEVCDDTEAAPNGWWRDDRRAA